MKLDEVEFFKRVRSGNKLAQHSLLSTEVCSKTTYSGVIQGCNPCLIDVDSEGLSLDVRNQFHCA